MKTGNEFPRLDGKVDGRILIGVVTLAIVIVAAVWLFRGEPEPEPVPAPGPGRETVAPAETAAERGDSAREIIDELSGARGEVDFGRAYERAREFQAEGRLADAQLLYFFAARNGHAGAAFDLATFYDPAHHPETTSLMDEPDAFQAYRWYREAEQAGHETAAARLADLRTWAQQAAERGDTEAERLLLQWEQ